MNNIPPLSQYLMQINNVPTQVAPARPVMDRPATNGAVERRLFAERRRVNKRPGIERRVSSDRRHQRFYAKA